MQRKLASIQKIKELRPIPKADKIEEAIVLGWHLVVRKDEFKVGDYCIYFEIDSLLPEKPEYEFLRSRKFRIKTMKMRGVVSQGLALPTSILPPEVEIVEGIDITEILGVKKYEPPIAPALMGMAKGQFPTYIVPKTDEMRIQSVPEVLAEIANKYIYITEKLDGTSFTAYFKDGEFGVCSRNLELKDDGRNIYWQVTKKYGIEEKLRGYHKPIAIQGEIVGFGINRGYELKEQQLYVFSVYDIEQQKYLDFNQTESCISFLGLKQVPIIYTGFCPDSIEKLLEMACGKSHLNREMDREGIVVRPKIETYSEALRGRLSFKVVNNEYLLKGGE